MNRLKTIILLNLFIGTHCDLIETWTEVNKNESITDWSWHALIYHGKTIETSTEVKTKEPERITDWPWHAAIYLYGIDDHIPRYICGGSVIGPSAILTAAHCVSSRNGIQIEAKQIAVSLGGLISDEGSQLFEVTKIIIHQNFSISDYSNDIAIVLLSTDATFSNKIQLIHLWESESTDISEIVHKEGTVVGWSQTGKLWRADMPVVSHLTCLRSNRNHFGALLSDTNFCAGCRSGSSACMVDSGGSMTFSLNGTHYIRGIVSVGKCLSGTCDSIEYTLFTDVAQYLPWIEEQSEQKARSTNGWVAGIYLLSRDTFTFKCAGTLIHPSIVLTSAMCVFENGQKVNSRRLRIELGKSNAKASSTQDVHQVWEIIPHPAFSVSTLENNIAIIRLWTEASLNDAVQTVRLWNGTELPESINKLGSLVGWGMLETSTGMISEELQTASMAVVSRVNCMSSSTEVMYLPDENFCAVNREGTRLHSSHNGALIIFVEDGIHQLRGIMSKIADTHDQYVVFTDVVKFTPWIQQVAPELLSATDTTCTCTTTSTPTPDCQLNEEFEVNRFRYDETCEKYGNPIRSEKSTEGKCWCKEGFVRLSVGVCVLSNSEECRAKMPPTEETCSRKQNERLSKWMNTEAYDNTCEDHNLPCSVSFRSEVFWKPHCVCKTGFARLVNGTCVDVHDPECAQFWKATTTSTTEAPTPPTTPSTTPPTTPSTTPRTIPTVPTTTTEPPTTSTTTLRTTTMPTAQQWNQLPGGAIIDVSVKGNELWVINSNQKIFRWTGSSWQQKPGGAVTVGASPDGWSWVVNAATQIYRWNKNINFWEMIPGGLVQISAMSKDIALGVNRAGHIYLYEYGAWSQMPGNAMWAAIGDDDERWVVNSAQQIFRWNYARNNWDRKSGSAVNIDVQNAQRIIMTTAIGEMYVWVKNRWILLKEAYGTRATINENFVYYLGDNNHVYKGRVDHNAM